MDENALSNRVIGAAIELHRVLGSGLLESAYRDCLAHELTILGLKHRVEAPITVSYKGLRVEAAYKADLIVADRLIVELRAAEINHCPKIAQDVGPDARRGKGRIAALCNPCRNNEAGPKDKRDWTIYFFRGPKDGGVDSSGAQGPGVDLLCAGVG